jgi:hypothetical protein
MYQISGLSDDDRMQDSQELGHYWDAFIRERHAVLESIVVSNCIVQPSRWVAPETPQLTSMGSHGWDRGSLTIGSLLDVPIVVLASCNPSHLGSIECRLHACQRGEARSRMSYGGGESRAINYPGDDLRKEVVSMSGGDNDRNGIYHEYGQYLQALVPGVLR